MGTNRPQTPNEACVPMPQLRDLRPFRVRRRAAFQPRVGHCRQVLVQLVDEARLPDSGLAEDEAVLPLAVLRPLPAIDERSEPMSRLTKRVRCPSATLSWLRTPPGCTTR